VLLDERENLAPYALSGEIDKQGDPIIRAPFAFTSPVVSIETLRSSK
jgi:hypothetical protein